MSMRHIHPENSVLDYNHIIDSIYIGTNQCCVMGLGDVLKKEGITADVSLEESRLDAPFGVEMYVWIPVIDEQAPSDNQLAFGSESIERLVALGKKVYVHCKNGHGRAPTMVAAYLIRKKYTPKDAIKLIASKRLNVHLHPPQQHALERYYRVINKKL